MEGLTPEEQDKLETTKGCIFITSLLVIMVVVVSVTLFRLWQRL